MGIDTYVDEDDRLRCGTCDGVREPDMLDLPEDACRCDDNQVADEEHEYYATR